MHPSAKPEGSYDDALFRSGGTFKGPAFGISLDRNAHLVVLAFPKLTRPFADCRAMHTIPHTTRRKAAWLEEFRQSNGTSCDATSPLQKSQVLVQFSSMSAFRDSIVHSAASHCSCLSPQTASDQHATHQTSNVTHQTSAAMLRIASRGVQCA